MRTAADGQRVADDLFPYLWANTRYLLRPPANDEALRVLDEFIETRGEKLIADPRKHLIFSANCGQFSTGACAPPTGRGDHEGGRVRRHCAVRATRDNYPSSRAE